MPLEMGKALLFPEISEFSKCQVGERWAKALSLSQMRHRDVMQAIHSCRVHCSDSSSPVAAPA